VDQVKTHGWTDEAISAGVEKEQLPISMVGLLTPTELVEWFMQDANQQFARQLDRMDDNFVDRPLPDRIALAIQTRLQYVVPYLSTWHQGMALGAAYNGLTTAYQLEEIVNLIAQKVVGDERAPFGQLERTVIGGLYVATELHLLTDKSPQQEETWSFLQQRVQELNFVAQPMRSSSVVAASAVVASLAGAVTSLVQPAVAQGVMVSCLPQLMKITTPSAGATGTKAQDYADLPPLPTEEEQQQQAKSSN
jgi:rpsU-divergently transcribed protein